MVIFGSGGVVWGEKSAHMPTATNAHTDTTAIISLLFQECVQEI